jgi:hypothetical protein
MNLCTSLKSVNISVLLKAMDTTGSEKYLENK